MSLVGCGKSRYALLVEESRVPELASLGRQYASHPNHTTLVRTAGIDNVPIRVAVHEVGPRGADHVVVFIHGVFADHRTWRYIAGAMLDSTNTLILDLPGCGESDKPDPDDVPASTYTVPDLARRTLEALRAQLGERADKPRIHFVGHSLGGAVVMRMYIDERLRTEFADVLDRVDRSVFIAPLDVAVEKTHPVLIELARISGVRIWSARQLGVLQDRVAAGVLESTSDPSRALREECDWKVQTLRSVKCRRAMQAMLQRAVPYKDGRPDWDAIDPVVAGYPKFTPPTLIIWGVHDEVLPVSMGYKLASQLPNARLVTLSKGRHSVTVEEPSLIAHLISAWFRGEEPGREVPTAIPLGQ